MLDMERLRSFFRQLARYDSGAGRPSREIRIWQISMAQRAVRMIDTAIQRACVGGMTTGLD